MRKMSFFLTVLAMLAAFAAQAQDPSASTVFRIDSDASRLRVLATPDGPLRRFGHHHVISHHGISGTVQVASNPLESSISLELNVADFVVDDSALRAFEGEDYEKDVPQKDKDGTKSNMLGEELLNGENFPTIRIQSSAIEGSLPQANIVATVAVAGMENTVTFPASIVMTDDSFVAMGQLEIVHGELGLSPFTAMGGALSVGDMMVLKYEITGVLATDSD